MTITPLPDRSSTSPAIDDPEAAVHRQQAAVVLRRFAMTVERVLEWHLERRLHGLLPTNRFVHLRSTEPKSAPRATIHHFRYLPTGAEFCVDNGGRLTQFRPYKKPRGSSAGQHVRFPSLWEAALTLGFTAGIDWEAKEDEEFERHCRTARLESNVADPTFPARRLPLDRFPDEPFPLEPPPYDDIDYYDDWA